MSRLGTQLAALTFAVLALLTLVNADQLNPSLHNVTGDLTVRDGQLLVPDGTAAAPSITSPTGTTTGFFVIGSGVWGFSSGGSAQFRLGSTLDLANSGAIRWSSTSNPSGSVDVSLSRDVANVLRLADGDSFLHESNMQIAQAAALGNPSTNQVRFYTREDIDQGAGLVAVADCALVARLSDATEVLIQVLVTDGGCP